jgi:uncharacterized membrane protein
MKTYLVCYLATALIFLGIDSVWLAAMGNALYRPLLGGLLADKFAPVPALAFYAIYVAGIVYFPITAAFASGRWTTATIQGAVFGLVAYATYDLTNQATLRNWSTLITIVDLCWGTLLTAAAATLSYLVVNSIMGPPAR